MRRLLVIPLLAAGLAACGGAQAPTSPSGGSTERAAAPAVALPAVQVTDLRESSTLSLRTLTAKDKPLLVWFWAPY